MVIQEEVILTQALRITFLHYAAPPVIGGVERVLAQQAMAAAAAGHRVSVIAGRGATWQREIPVFNLPLVDSTHPAILAAKAQLDRGAIPPDFPTLTAQIEHDLQATLAEAGTQVLVAHNVASLAKNLPLTAALHSLTQRPGAPGLVLWHHDLAWGATRDHSELFDGEPWHLLRRDWPWAQQVVISDARRDELAALGIPVARIHVVPNGVDQAGLLKLETQTQELADALGLWRADPLLLLPARITRRKNIAFALRVLAHLREGEPDVQLVVTGPTGPHNPANRDYFDELLDLRAELGLEGSAHFLAESVASAGARHAPDAGVPDAVIADLYRLAGALFLPSLDEGFGIPLLEAAMTRLPIFCSDIPPLREVAQGDATFFALDADPAAVARLIEETLAGLATARFGARARRFSWRRLWQERIEPIICAAAETAARPAARPAALPGTTPASRRREHGSV